MSLRDPEFTESYDGFIATSSLEDSGKLPKEQVGSAKLMIWAC